MGLFEALFKVRDFEKKRKEREKCSCELNCGKCKREIRVSDCGVLSMENYMDCPRFVRKLKNEASSLECPNFPELKGGINESH